MKIVTQFTVLEMKANELEIKIVTIGQLKTEIASPIIAMYLIPKGGYGFTVHETGAFYYFDYDSWESADQNESENRIKNGRIETDSSGGRLRSQIISWYFSYEKENFFYIDDASWKIMVLQIFHGHVESEEYHEPDQISTPK